MNTPEPEQKQSSLSNLIAPLLIIMMIGILFIKDEQLEKKSIQADVYIQAGHEGRFFGNTGSVSKYGREID